MASALRLWFLGRKKKKDDVSDETLMMNSSSSDWGFALRERETVKFPVASPRKIQNKQQSREDWRTDMEHDIVLVPSDGLFLSDSDSDDSDWSIGWLEPHAFDFLSDDDDSFAVLVPCYRNIQKGLTTESSRNQLLFDNNGFTGQPSSSSLCNC